MNKAQVIWTNEAFDDLLTIEDFLGAVAADKVIERIINKARQLSEFPEIGAVQLTTATGEYRYLVDGNYKIIYSFAPPTVYIHTVFDTRQDPGKLKLKE